MKICLVSREYPWREPFGGVGASTADMARALANAGQQVTVITQSPTQDRQETEQSGVRLIGLPFHPFRGLPRRLANFSSLESLAWGRLVAHAFRKDVGPDADIVEAPEMSGEGLDLLRLRERPPVVIKIHAGTSLCLKTLGCYQWYHYPVFRRERLSLLRADAVAALSKQALRENETHFRLSLPSVTLVPNPTDTDRFTPVASGRDPASPPRVLFVGRLNAVKGFDLMPDIIRHVLDRDPRVEFTFVGAEGLVSRLDDRPSRKFLAGRLPAGHLRRVTFAGTVPTEKMPAFYRQHDIVVAPSRSEAWSRVCAEAAASGIPVVGSRGTGMERVIVDGSTGYLAETERPDSFATHLLDLIGHPNTRRDMGLAARRHAEKHFSFPAFAHGCLKFYTQVIKEYE